MIRPKPKPRKRPPPAPLRMTGTDGRQLAAALKTARKAKGLVQMELAGKIGVPADKLTATIDRYNQACVPGEWKPLELDGLAGPRAVKRRRRGGLLNECEPAGKNECQKQMFHGNR